MLSFPSLSFLRPLLLVAGCLGVVLFARVASARKRRNPRGLPLPPGPRGLPIIGNVLEVPAYDQYPWKTYHELCKAYGGMVYLSVMGQGTLVLDSLADARELLDKRSATYSDRPNLPAVELIEHTEWSFVAMSYGPIWKNYRRTFHQNMHHNRVIQYHPIMGEQRDELLRSLRQSPADFLKHVRMYFGKAIMRASYGIDDMEKNELFIYDAEKITKAFADATAPGKFMVNMIPLLRHIPEWVPGAGFRKTFRGIVEESNKAMALPYEQAKVGLAEGKGSAHPSMAAALIENLPDEAQPNRLEMENFTKNICAATYIAGADTSVASATGLVLVLASRPDIQKKAQAELDTVVGKDRLPEVADRDALPYLHAILKEIGRWYSITPLGVTHATTADDEYKGYFIPKGTVVMANSWAILHDPETFEKPFDFIPERYLKDGKVDPSVPDPEVAAFGFGRRICPGRHFSNDAIFLFAASILASFDITPSVDEAGIPIPLKLEVTSGLASKPLPFKCNFTPRAGRGI